MQGHTGSCGVIWGHMWPCGAIQGCVEPYRATRGRMGPCGAVWGCWSKLLVHIWCYRAGTHLVQEAVGEGEVLSRVGGEDGRRLPWPGGGEGPIAVGPDGVCGAEPCGSGAPPAARPPHGPSAGSVYRNTEHRRLRRRGRTRRSARPRRWGTSTTGAAPAGTWRGRKPGSGGPLGCGRRGAGSGAGSTEQSPPSGAAEPPASPETPPAV